jgi:5-deoxy-D-glucuronate isomerase
MRVKLLLPFDNQAAVSDSVRKKQKCIAKVQTEKENSADRLVVAHVFQQDKSSSQ